MTENHDISGMRHDAGQALRQFNEKASSAHPWTHPTNPTEARLAPDGRIALRIAVRATWDRPDAVHRWFYADAPNGQFTITILADEDVADWTPLPLDGEPQ